MIGLLDVLQLQLIDIALLHTFLALHLIDGLDLTLLLDLHLDGTLLLVHLTKQREELGSLLGRQTGFLGDKLLHIRLERQTGFLGDKLLHIRLEFLRGELLRLVGKGRYTQEQDNTQG